MHIEKKMLVLPVLIMMALSMTGVAMAHWRDSIQLKGKISMGSLTLAFSTPRDPEPEVVEWHILDNGDRERGEPCGKEVAVTTAVYENWIVDEHTGKGGYKTLVITIDNAYPCYEPHVWFVLHNIGTTPMDIENYLVSDPTGELTPVCRWELDAFLCDLEDENGVPVINLAIVNGGLPFQLDPCYDEKMEIDIHIKQEALECHTYQFEVMILAHEWACED